MARKLKMLQVYAETHTEFGDLAHDARDSIRGYMEKLAARMRAEAEIEKAKKAKQSDK